MSIGRTLIVIGIALATTSVLCGHYCYWWFLAVGVLLRLAAAALLSAVGA